MTRTLRLDPACPPLWRTPDSLQLGVTGAVVIDHPSSWQLELLTALEHGFPAAELGRIATVLNASESSARAFLRLVAPALVEEHERIDVQLTLVEGAADHATARVFAGAVEDAGARISADGRAVIVLTPVTLLPRTTTRWMSNDIPHLPISVTADAIDVGPVIVPGRSACASCLADERRDANPAWPALVAQMIGRTIALPTEAMFMQAGIAAMDLLRAGIGDDSSSRSLRIERTNQQSSSIHRPRADCGCQSLARTEMACAAVALPLPAATTMPAFERRA